MSVGYVPVQWSRPKRIYDAVIALGVIGFLATFVAITVWGYRGIEAPSPPILLMRALGSCAFLMLHVILCIGPLARLDRRFLILLYNRRHLGVATFAVGLAHATVALGFYHGFGVVNPFVSLLTRNTNYASLGAFPFQVLGLLALVILFLMAATSHDFWLKTLSARTWKALHMAVYPAYALLVMHVALGALQSQRSTALAAALVCGVSVISGLHAAAGIRETAGDRRAATGKVDTGWIDVAAVADVAEGRGFVVCRDGAERVALFRYEGGISAISNVCAHQGGPLGEGRIIDGCVTCPWHGWQYRPGDGCSPPPFAERLPTYRVRIVRGRVWIDPTPLAPGTAVQPARPEDHSND